MAKVDLNTPQSDEDLAD